MLRISSIYFAFALIGLLFTATHCRSSSSEQLPLSDEKMADIVADLAIAEAATRELNYQVRDSATVFYYKQVFEYHKVNKEEFENNIRLAGKDFDHIDQIYRLAEEKLTDKKEEKKPGNPVEKVE